MNGTPTVVLILNALSPVLFLSLPSVCFSVSEQFLNNLCRKNLIIVHDFNFLNIDWRNNRVGSRTTCSYKFWHLCLLNSLTQLVEVTSQEKIYMAN